MIIAAIAVVVIDKLNGACIWREKIACGPGRSRKVRGSRNDSVIAKGIRNETSSKRRDWFIPVRAIRGSAASRPHGISSGGHEIISQCEIRHPQIGYVVANAKQRVRSEARYMIDRNV